MDRNDFRNPARRTGYDGDLEPDRVSDVGPPINRKANIGSENRGAKAPESGSGAVIGSGASALAYLLLTVPQVVMVESFLSFLGLGVQEPLTSLGILVKDGADDMDIAPHLLFFPGGVLVAILISLTLVGERLRDRLAA